MTQEGETLALVQRLRPQFAGRPPEVQGAALADLLAIWLASHVWRNNVTKAIDPAETDRMREELLEHHIAIVREMLKVEHDAIYGRRMN